MRDTSIEAYHSIKPDLAKKHKEVMRVLRNYPHGVALFELPDVMGWPVHVISPRISELCKKGMVEAIGKKVNPHTGRKSTIWRVK